MAENTAELVDEDDYEMGPGEYAEDEEPVIADLLVEEVSIDGMCGVY
jgi:mycofactocin precursor